jgi:hypothetical protein
MKKKWIAIGMILMFVSAALLPNIAARITDRMREGLLQNQGFFSNGTMTDWTDDVCSLNYLNNKCTVIMNSTDIEVDNLDLIQTSYLQQGSLVTLSVQVVGRIEDRGQPYWWNTTNETVDVVEYAFSFTTSEQDYLVSYINQTGFVLFNGSQINLTSSDYIVVDNTLSITFPLVDPNESYENLSVIAYFLKFNLSKPRKIIFFFDSIPNYWSKVFLFGRYIGSPLKGAYMTVIAVNLWMIRINSNQILRYRLGDIIRVSTPYKARIITNHFLFGFFDILQI